MSRSEFSSNIPDVRAVEDCIRATKKYTEGAFSRRRHPEPTQGDGFPSRVLTKYYEVYPDMDLEQIRSFWDAVMSTSDWLWGDVPHIDVRFHYNYLLNRAIIVISGGNGVLKELEKGIPGLADALEKVRATSYDKAAQ